MSDKPHQLAQELPEYKDAIHYLKITNAHFAKILNAYHECVKEILRIEDDIETTSDAFLEDLKKQRLAMKDEMVGMLSKT